MQTVFLSSSFLGLFLSLFSLSAAFNFAVRHSLIETIKTTPLGLAARSPSKVSEEDVADEAEEGMGTQDILVDENADLPTMTIEELEAESKYDADKHPLPDQPWRRGRTNGAEDPIAAPWRREAEDIIALAAERVGGVVEGITWYNGKCVITIHRDCLDGVIPALTGPTVNVVSDMEAREARSDFEWQDKPMYERQLEEEGIANLPVMRKKIVTKDDQPLNTDAISSIAQSVLEALNDPDVDERLDISSRHEIIITTPGISNVLETQKEFDAFVGFDVSVKTIDPFKSNRILKGKLVERNALDLKINVKGRIVTIPLNFVDQVVLPPAKKEKGDSFNL
jgi:ribosome maturation factor RimP